jgi:RNA polymerase sigma-70 factor (ECF subfamily)
LERSVQKRSAGQHLPDNELEAYIHTLHLEDLALACACEQASEKAWEHFVSTYQNYLRACAGAILRSSASSPAACELADSLFADLYGVDSTKAKGRSLLRYFHGRSSLKTWLRAVLAQRHIDTVRAGRRFTDLPTDGERNDGDARPRMPVVSPMPTDPDRQRYLTAFSHALDQALAKMAAPDKERLRLYYAENATLAEIGRRFGEHESTASRNLERIRREIKQQVEESFREGTWAEEGAPKPAGFSDEEISLSFEYAAEDAPLDFDTLFAKEGTPSEKSEGRET